MTILLSNIPSYPILNISVGSLEVHAHGLAEHSLHVLRLHLFDGLTQRFAVSHKSQHRSEVSYIDISDDNATFFL